MNPNRIPLIIAGTVVLVVAIVAVLAIVLSGNDDSDAATDDTLTEPVSTGESDGGEETRPVSISGAVLPVLDGSVADVAVGATAPIIEGEGFDGSPITIGGPTDGPTMVVFLAHWCPHCNDEIPELLELQERGDIPDNLGVVGVSTAVVDGRPNFPPSEWLVDKGWPWPAMADDAASQSFGAFGGSQFPLLVLLDGDGAVIARQSGQKSADDIEAWLDESLASVST